jgi:actin-like ATPase involved in cell morphogenesis
MIWAVADEAGIINLMLKRYGLRIAPAMSEYVLQQLDNAGEPSSDAGIPVMGGDARTGVPVRLVIPTHELRDAMQSGELGA